MSETATKQDHGIACVWGPSVDQFWPAVYEMVAAACDYTLTPSDVRNDIYDGDAILWLVLDGEDIKAAAVTQTQGNAGTQWVAVLTLGGSDFSAWSERLQGEFERYAREMGCGHIRAQCRPGMAKWLAGLGWRQRQITMEWSDGR